MSISIRCVGVIALVCLARVPILHGQMAQQRECSQVVKADMEKTRTENPDVFATVKDYTFVWSKSRQTCVIVIQYRIHEVRRQPEIQILAINAVTMQPMEGYKNIFIVPANNLHQIMESSSFLFNKYSR